MREPYYEDTIDKMEVDEDPVTTFGQLILLAADMTVPQMVSVVNLMDQESASKYDENELENNSNKIKCTTKTLGYKAYGADNIIMFIQLMREEDAAVVKQVKTCRIPRSTAYEILQQWKESDGTAVSIGYV